MRLRLLAMLLVAMTPAMAFAQTTTDDASAVKAHFAKLLPLAGTLRCSDTGPGDKPYIATVKVEGGWLVWREQTDDPATEYMRWNPQLKSYVVAEIEQGGSLNVSTTTDADPLNASWKTEFPAHNDVQSFHTSFANGTFTVALVFALKNGKTYNARLSCKKI
jgi:hypothetical protein